MKWNIEGKLDISSICGKVFAKNAQGIKKIFHEVKLSVKCLLTKPQVKSMDMKYYDLLYTVIETLTEVEKNEISNKSLQAVHPT